MLGKENKGRMMNNVMEHREQTSILETTDRFREKRNTHNLISYETSHNKLLEVKKTNNFIGSGNC